MSEGLWHLTRTLPENHALMVCLGEGLMPKAGETPEMGANPMLGFGRVYARPELARTVDRRVRRLLNEPGHSFEQFYEWLQGRGITLWGAAVDTLENTSRFAEGQPTGPMAVLHLFDSPLRLARPYESYMGCLTVPTRVAEAAEQASVLLDYRTPRTQVVEAIEAAYPGIRRENIHVWTLRGKSRVHRLGRLWEEWEKAGVHLVEDGWKAPSGLAVFTDSGTYAPTFLVGSWTDGGATHVFLCDGYAATAEAMQAASLSDVLDVDGTMALFSPTFELPVDVEGAAHAARSRRARLRRAAEGAHRRPGRRGRQGADVRRSDRGGGGVEHARSASRCCAPTTSCPRRTGRCSPASATCATTPTRAPPASPRSPTDAYRVTTRLATRKASSVVTFTLRLMEPLETTRQVFSPLLVRFLSGVDHTTRPVKISDSGRIRNELQTMIPQALEHANDRIRVHFERINEMVLPRDKQATIRDVLAWYKANHPVWFDWLDLA